MIKLSIVTINYNNSSDLQRTIQSVINQSWKSFEYIVIDGGSNDNSIDVIKQYENRINYWVSERDKGVFNAMNKGLAKATGEYILMLNAGDVLYNHDVLKEVFEKNNFTEDILYGDVVRESKGIEISRTPFPSDVTFQNFRHGSISHQATFVRKSIHDIVGIYDENLIFSSDRKFFMLAICKYNIKYRHMRFYISICNCDGLTCRPENFPAMEVEAQKIINEYFPAFVKDYEHYERLINITSGAFMKKYIQRVKTKVKKIVRRG